MGSSTRNNDVTVTVAGELDATEGGTITKATTGTVNLYSTGTTSMYSAINTSVIGVNSAMYYDGEYVYTSVANAIAYAEENGLTSVNVYGTFTESGDIDSMGVDILVYGKVTLGNVTLSDADIKIADSASGAYYTATVSGLNGEGDAAVQSTVSVSRTTATISSNVILNGEGVNVYTMYISEIDGATQFTAGTYTYNGDENITLSRESGNSVTVASGATFVIGSSINLYNSGFITNEGTIQVAEDVTLTIGTAILPGDVVIPEDAAMSVSDELTVTGTLTVEANGRLTVTGHIQVGETPRLSNATTSGDLVGNVLLDGDAYVLVYNGASVTDATIGNEAGSDLNTTTYVINGSSFATIITTGDVPLKTINEVVEGLRDLSIPLDDNDLPNTSADDIPIIVWYVGETAVSDTTSELDADVGEYPEVTTEIAYSGVTVTVSVGTGITLSIDGIIVTDMAAYAGQYLSIGTHTVSAVVNPGYAGDITIQFNGQTVTNGEIEITSDMLGQTNLVLSATGNITTTGGSGSSDITVNVPSQDDGMSLTDILLIVLVILILVMAIIVALRLMRS